MKNIFEWIFFKIENIVLLCSNKFDPKFDEIGNGMKILIAKMCKVIGVKVKDIDFSRNDWYSTQEWTTKQEHEYKQWMLRWIPNNDRLARQVFRGTHDAIGCFRWFNLMWGWKSKDV